MSIDSLASPGGPRRQFSHAEEATVRRSGSGGVFVTVDRIGDRREYGPCRWQHVVTGVQPTMDDPGDPHDHDTGAATDVAGDAAHDHTVGMALRRDYPPPGTRCLVMFAGRATTRPWIIAFDGWPQGER